MSKTTEQDVDFIKALADLLKASDLAEIEIDRTYGDDDELKVRLTRIPPAGPVTAAAPQTAVAPAQVPHASAPRPEPEEPAENGPDLSNAVTSPMVGTVYLATEPGAAPFVAPGDHVQEGQTILIIEAMKTMNQIPAPHSGTVRTVLVENAEPVEFGEPLMIIE